MIVRGPAAPLAHLRTGPLARVRSVASRPGATRRWTVVGLAVVILCSLPALVGALPVSTPERSLEELLADVRSSASVPFTGYAEARGTLNLPDVSSVTGPTVNLLSDRSRLRIWHAGANRFRVDRLTLGAETSRYVSGDITLSWDSDTRRISREVANPQLPLPEPPDVLPTSLGRRLVEALPADGAGVRLGGTDRIAGRATREVRWTPNDRRSLVGDVRLWVDPTNGLPLRVELRPVGSELVAFETGLIDLTLAPPDPEVLRFDVNGTQRADVSDALPPSGPDLIPPFRLPPALVGLRQRSDAAPFVATYGDGVALVAVAGLDSATADSIRQQIDSGGRSTLRGTFGEGTLIEAPMLRALIFSSADRGYVLAGTVTVEVLQAMALELATNPPERTFP